ncbi:ABC transporter ATP-binding protein [Faecalicatena acetigenes]|uniref:ABC transporter ATP-binding protein n=1 Tax=Faecalicatena acetigenes TaxID=2981790 RepID=A0ABT2T8C4_9FIRM|nr:MULTISPECIES: ABC transporter ATP-binding protein [Lachnospiraceae]MCU6746467.1 ABC transporter ATP-binding protein [Faecalicatena acetigenes]SCH19822.1 Lipoprotein-releasing system ATP-binding protein LolD [uncultured Clostridium sp.]
MSILELENVEKIYGEKDNQVKALRNINLKVEKGEFVAIVGTSGSGKSTCLNLIGGLDNPTSGKIFIKNKEIGSLSRKELTIFRRRNIGFVFQNYSLMPVLNVYDNVSLPITFDRGKHINQKYIEELLRELGIWEKRKKYPNELSGGQQQRVAIARALANKPSILLCDEPTGNLDSATTIEVMGLLKASCRKYNQTILMVTHNEAIAQTCDRVIHIEDGQIVTGKRRFPAKGGDVVC